ncbi:hypothetical protein [Spongiimicrobium salis]|uniref:hypothetical protein n=1 Tax=Spongiimicrobium salis TaxID=1667022 RepID=UPI00374CA031
MSTTINNTLAINQLNTEFAAFQSATKEVSELTDTEKNGFLKELNIDPIINGFQTEKADKVNGDFTTHEVGDIFKGETTIGGDQYYVKYKVTSLSYDISNETGLIRITKTLLL